MHRSPSKTVAATLLAMAAVSYLTACSSSGTHPAAPTSPPAVSSSSASATGTPTAAPQIVIDNFAFGPANLSVAPGRTVTVVNKDSTTHTVTAATGKAFDTGAIAPGKAGSFIAPTTPGTYSYICTIHQFMHGTLTVK